MPEPPPLLVAGSEFHGTLVLHGAARIDGRMRGEILGADLLHIGPSGAVSASVEAEEVVVAGRLEGAVRARQRVELRATGRLRGRVETPRLTVAEGGILEGSCRAGDSAARASEADREGRASP